MGWETAGSVTTVVDFFVLVVSTDQGPAQPSAARKIVMMMMTRKKRRRSGRRRMLITGNDNGDNNDGQWKRRRRGVDSSCSYSPSTRARRYIKKQSNVSMTPIKEERAREGEVCSDVFLGRRSSVSSFYTRHGGFDRSPNVPRSGIWNLWWRTLMKIHRHPIDWMESFIKGSSVISTKSR